MDRVRDTDILESIDREDKSGQENQTEQARGTHFLESLEGGTS
jgi:hypothetical protein